VRRGHARGILEPCHKEAKKDRWDNTKQQKKFWMRNKMYLGIRSEKGIYRLLEDGGERSSKKERMPTFISQPPL
jgi:hypothetical protein